MSDLILNDWFAYCVLSLWFYIYKEVFSDHNYWLITDLKQEKREKPNFLEVVSYCNQFMIKKKKANQLEDNQASGMTMFNLYREESAFWLSISMIIVGRLNLTADKVIKKKLTQTYIFCWSLWNVLKLKKKYPLL